MRYNISKAKTLIRKAAKHNLWCKLEDNNIYLSNNEWLFKMSESEYESIVADVLPDVIDKFNWHFERGQESAPIQLGCKKLLTGDCKDTQLSALPLLLDTGAYMVRGFYSYNGNFVWCCQETYFDAINSSMKGYSKGTFQPVVFYDDYDPFALILPIRAAAPYLSALETYAKENKKI